MKARIALSILAKIGRSAWTWIALCLFGGTALVVTAIFLLVGGAWAILASGVGLILFALFLMRGIANG